MGNLESAEFCADKLANTANSDKLVKRNLFSCFSRLYVLFSS